MKKWMKGISRFLFLFFACAIKLCISIENETVLLGHTYYQEQLLVKQGAWKNRLYVNANLHIRSSFKRFKQMFFATDVNRAQIAAIASAAASTLWRGRASTGEEDAAATLHASWKMVTKRWISWKEL